MVLRANHTYWLRKFGEARLNKANILSFSLFPLLTCNGKFSHITQSRTSSIYLKHVSWLAWGTRIPRKKSFPWAVIGLNAGCVEAATMSGKMIGSVLTGNPPLKDVWGIEIWCRSYSINSFIEARSEMTGFFLLILSIYNKLKELIYRWTKVNLLESW